MATAWQAIRAQVLERASYVCDWPECGAEDGEEGYHDKDGRFYVGSNGSDRDHMEAIGSHPVTIRLLVGRFDGDATNNDPENLRAWCQRHHAEYIRVRRPQKRISTLARNRGQLVLELRPPSVDTE